jgi:hypothetical protein
MRNETIEEMIRGGFRRVLELPALRILHEAPQPAAAPKQKLSATGLAS